MTRKTLFRLAPAAVAGALSIGAIAPANAAPITDPVSPDAAGFSSVIDLGALDVKLDARTNSDVLVESALEKSYQDIATVVVAEGYDADGDPTRWALFEVDPSYGTPEGAYDVADPILGDTLVALGDEDSLISATEDEFALNLDGMYETVVSEEYPSVSGFSVSVATEVLGGYTYEAAVSDEDMAAAAQVRDSSVDAAHAGYDAELLSIDNSYQPVRDLADDHGHPELDGAVTDAKAAIAAANAEYDEAAGAAQAAIADAQKAEADADAAHSAAVTKSDAAVAEHGAAVAKAATTAAAADGAMARARAADTAVKAAAEAVQQAAQKRDLAAKTADAAKAKLEKAEDRVKVKQKSVAKNKSAWAKRQLVKAKASKGAKAKDYRDAKKALLAAVDVFDAAQRGTAPAGDAFAKADAAAKAALAEDSAANTAVVAVAKAAATAKAGVVSAAAELDAAKAASLVAYETNAPLIEEADTVRDEAVEVAMADLNAQVDVLADADKAAAVEVRDTAVADANTAYEEAIAPVVTTWGPGAVKRMDAFDAVDFGNPVPPAPAN